MRTGRTHMRIGQTYTSGKASTDQTYMCTGGAYILAKARTGQTYMRIGQTCTPAEVAYAAQQTA